MIVDYLFGSVLLDSFLPGLSSILNIVIIAWIPIIIASVLLDRRSQPTEAEAPRRPLPRGARSASGEPMTRSRPQPRIRRDKRAAELETIVVEPGASGSSPLPTSSASPSNSGTQQDSPSRFLRARRTRSEETEETDEQVEEQLAAIEEEMAKLEEQLAQNGLSTTTSNSNSPQTTETNQDRSESVATPEISNRSEFSSEEMSSERQAIDELLNRLDQRMRAGGVDEATYQRLREKYLKRRAELS
jgi:hypothetical protein